MPTLKIVTFGQTRVTVDRQKIAWCDASGRHLSFYLLALPYGRGQRDAAPALWPDEENENAADSNRLQVALLREHGASGQAKYALTIRRLGHDPVTFRQFGHNFASTWRSRRYGLAAPNSMQERPSTAHAHLSRSQQGRVCRSGRVPDESGQTHYGKAAPAVGLGV